MISINNQILDYTLFPGGECHIRIPQDWISAQTQITAHLNQAQDIIALMMVIDAIRRIDSNSEISLTIPYFPYARQDRVCNPGESLSVKVMATLVNQLNCRNITIFDPHSDVLPALIDNCHVKTQADIIIETKLLEKINLPTLTLVAPDNGAEKKVRTLCERIISHSNPINYIAASKIRDLMTGRIIQSRINDSVEDKDLLILDDICDGGSTFNELAKILRNKGANRLYLYVTHGIFSKGLTELSQWFNHIYCYNLMNSALKNYHSLTVL